MILPIVSEKKLNLYVNTVIDRSKLQRLGFYSVLFITPFLIEQFKLFIATGLKNNTDEWHVKAFDFFLCRSNTEL